MQTLAEGDVIVVVLGAGEEIVASLKEVASAHDIRGGSLTGLGSVSEAEVAFFDPELKEYVSRTFYESMEIGSLVGNFSILDDERHVHVHVTLAGPELIAFTGHLVRGVTGTACEIHIRKLSREIQRVNDPDGGFKPLRIQS